MKTLLRNTPTLSVIEQLNTMLVILNNIGELLYVNPYAQKVLGDQIQNLWRMKKMLIFEESKIRHWTNLLKL